MTGAAIASLFEQGEYSEHAGDWTEALRKYDRLKRIYPLSPAENMRADQARARVYTKWAEKKLEDELIDKLAERLADSIYKRVLRLIK